jgi:prolyl-tRNA editing enzyme YbaK/EbsC (Cys-tRNA(Pro) deacylase)
VDDVERLNAASSFRYAFLIVATMSTPVLGQLIGEPALERPDLLAPPVHAFLSRWDRAGEVGVAEIDPELADTAACAEAYDLPMESGANCVVVSGRRAGEERLAACLVRADTRADVNNVVKRALDVRKCSFHPMERAVEETGMEYGGITPLGLPDGWRLLVDNLVVDIDVAVIGSGVRRSKLLVPGALLADLPGAEVSAIRQA